MIILANPIEEVNLIQTDQEIRDYLDEKIPSGQGILNPKSKTHKMQSIGLYYPFINDQLKLFTEFPTILS